MSGERGSGTVLALGLIAVVMVLGLALAALAAAQSARGRAQSGADLAALAAATAGRDGWDPCGTAREVAGRNGAALVGCETRPDGTVRVEVTCPTSVAVLRLVTGEAHAAAQAGPATARAGPTRP